MLKFPSISKQNPEFPNYLDFQKLRDIGIHHVQALSSQLWTDYNLHDPGVTILEVLCYAVTDLGYRNNLDIKDLLALDLSDPNSKENNFFTPDQILTCNPVTEIDLRKRLIDIPGVRNAWLRKIKNYEPAIYVNCDNGKLQYILPEDKSKENALKLNPRGLCSVSLDLEAERYKDACGQIYYSQAATLEAVKKVLCSYRNLCEDFYDVFVLGEEEIALCADIELEASADPEDVLVEIFVKVQDFLAPKVRFYTLKELLDKGKNPAEIFAGRPSAIAAHDSNSPYANSGSHGFIDTDELDAITSRQILYTSDLYQIIMDVPGVVAIKKLNIINYINDMRQSRGDPWFLHLTKDHRPILGVKHSTVTFYKEDLPFRPDVDEVKRRYLEQQDTYIKASRDDHELDLTVPRGSYNDLADHYSIHHDFPLTYGIGEDGLPGNIPALRKAQANQLKGYLAFFDQLLANYLAQLAHIRDLFSWEMDEAEDQPDNAQINCSKTRQAIRQRTYFTQSLNFPGVKDIISQEPNDINFLNLATEDKNRYYERRNRFLDHLLARFAESFTDYALLNYGIGKDRRNESEIINDKARFLQDYPALSRDRFRAFNYCGCDESSIWDTTNVPGFQKRVSRLLGIKNFSRRSLSHYEINQDEGGYYFILAAGSNDSLLKSKQIYPTADAAQAGLESMTAFIQSSEHFVKLSYYYLYYYGWEVIDTQSESLVTYDRYFPSQSERNTALSSLLEDLASVLSVLASRAMEDDETETTPAPLYYSLDSDTKGLFHFRLEIPVPEKSPIVFTGTKRYPTEADAIAAAEEAIARVQDNTAYRRIQLPQDEISESESDATRGFTYYGYGIVNPEGTLVAEATHLWTSELARDEAIEGLRTLVQNEAASSEIQQIRPSYIGKIYNKDNPADPARHILLQGIQPHATEASAWETSNSLLELTQDRNNFRLIDGDRDIYGWALTNKAKDRVLAERYYTNKDDRNQAIKLLQNRIDDEGFHLLEHILLRPQQKMMSPNDRGPLMLPISIKPADCEKKDPCRTAYDPYSFWVSIILPCWPKRFQNQDFRRLIERTLRLEAPAHIALKICWLDVYQMHKFEVAYRNWLEQFALDACQGEACDLTGTLDHLVEILNKLRSVYPEGTLRDFEETSSDDNPIILNQTALGTAND